MKDYTKIDDNELNELVDPTINLGAILLADVKEHQKRNPDQYISEDEDYSFEC